jgi:hypothetical protein
MANRYRLALLLGPFILLAPVWLTGKALFWGTVSLQFLPWRAFAWDILRSGHLPLWNPLNGMGAPLLANYQSALVYPPNWFLFLLDAVGGVSWAAWGQAILVAAHLAWAGLGMAFLARRLGLNELAQTVSGLAFGMSEYLVARSGFLSINAAAAWLPWVILCLQSLELGGPADSPGKGDRKSLKYGSFWGVVRARFCVLAREVRRVRWLAICLAMLLLAGHAQIAWYTLLLAFMWAAGMGWTKSGENQALQGANRLAADFAKRMRCVGEIWGRLLLALILAAGLAAIQLLPTAEYLMQSQRSSQVDMDFTLNYSFWPWRFLTLLAPDMFGNPARGDYWGYGNYWEDAAYIGVLPLLMALGAILRRKPLAKGLMALVVLSFILALGKNTPVFPWLYRWVPSFDMFQAPTRFSIWAVFALSLLAGLGVQTWKRPTGRGLYWTRLATAGAFAVTLGAGLGSYFFSSINLTYLRATALAGLWGLGSGLLALTAAPTDDGDDKYHPILVRLWPVGVVLFVAADLLVAGWGLNPGIRSSFYTQQADASQIHLDGSTRGRIYMPATVEDELKFKQFMRFDSLQPRVDWAEMRGTRLPNLNLLDGLPSANNFDPLIPGRYDRWLQALENPGYSPIALNLMAVSAVGTIEAAGKNGVAFEPIQSGERLRWVPCAQAAKDADSAWEALFTGQFDPEREVIIEGEGDASASDCQGGAAKADIQVVFEHTNQIVMHISAPSQGWFVLSDVWYPGWQARVDGRAAHIWRANYLFRAVQVEAGEHDVVFSYLPQSFYLGSFASLMALIVLWIALRII